MTGELPMIEKRTTKTSLGGHEIETHYLRVIGKDLSECAKVFDKRWKDANSSD